MEANTRITGTIESLWRYPVKSMQNVHMQVIDPSPRCLVPTLAQGGLPHDPGILRTINQHNAAASATLAAGVVFPAVAGVYARCSVEGVIRCSDVAWLGYHLSICASKWYTAMQ